MQAAVDCCRIPKRKRAQPLHFKTSPSPRPRPIHRLVHIPRERLPEKSTWLYMHLFWIGIQYDPMTSKIQWNKATNKSNETTETTQTNYISLLKNANNATNATLTSQLAFTFSGRPFTGMERIEPGAAPSGMVIVLGTWGAELLWGKSLSCFIKCQMKRMVKSFFWSACCLILHDTSWCPMSNMYVQKSFLQNWRKVFLFSSPTCLIFIFAPDNDVYRSWVGGCFKNNIYIYKVTLWNEVTDVNAACNPSRRGCQFTRNVTATSPRAQGQFLLASGVHWYISFLTAQDLPRRTASIV